MLNVMCVLCEREKKRNRLDQSQRVKEREEEKRQIGSTKRESESERQRRGKQADRINKMRVRE